MAEMKEKKIVDLEEAISFSENDYTLIETNEGTKKIKATEITKKLEEEVKEVKNKKEFNEPIFTDNISFVNSENKNISKFNFACVDTNRDGVPSHEMWILINAYYDKEAKRFKRVSIDDFSFGWQFQASGTYPGEEAIGDFINQGVNLWKASGRKAFEVGSELYNSVTEDIGINVNGEWKEFGYLLGWNNVFMNDSYGGMTIGGSGFEIDGSGLYPYSRVSHGVYRGGSKVHTDIKKYDFAYTGILTNSYHGMFDKDNSSEKGFYYGLKSKMKDIEPRTYVDHNTTYFTIMAHNAFADEVVEEWHEILKVTQDGVIEANPIIEEFCFEASIIGANKTDYQILFDYRIPINKDNVKVEYAICKRQNGEKVKIPLEGTPTISEFGVYGWIGHDSQGLPFEKVEIFVTDKTKDKSVTLKSGVSGSNIVFSENGDIHFNTKTNVYINGNKINL